MNIPPTSKKIYLDGFYLEQVQRTTWLIYSMSETKTINTCVSHNFLEKKHHQKTLNMIHSLANALTKTTHNGRPFFIDIIPSFESILIQTSIKKDTHIVIQKIQACVEHTNNKALENITNNIQNAPVSHNKNSILKNITFKDTTAKDLIYTVPVCYDATFALDKKIVEDKTQLSFSDIIKQHTHTTYTIQTIGFMPGFAYMGNTPTSLHLPRKTTPNTCIPKNSLAIAENKTAIYPSNSPGGWYIIGRTPLHNISESLNETQPHPLLTIGQKIQFYSVSLNEYNNWKKHKKSISL